jgi:hypothetical protein
VETMRFEEPWVILFWFLVICIFLLLSYPCYNQIMYERENETIRYTLKSIPFEELKPQEKHEVSIDVEQGADDAHKIVSCETKLGTHKFNIVHMENGENIVQGRDGKYHKKW